MMSGWVKRAESRGQALDLAWSDPLFPALLCMVQATGMVEFVLICNVSGAISERKTPGKTVGLFILKWWLERGCCPTVCLAFGIKKSSALPNLPVWISLQLLDSWRAASNLGNLSFGVTVELPFDSAWSEETWELTGIFPSVESVFKSELWYHSGILMKVLCSCLLTQCFCSPLLDIACFSALLVFSWYFTKKKWKLIDLCNIAAILHLGPVLACVSCWDHSVLSVQSWDASEAAWPSAAHQHRLTSPGVWRHEVPVWLSDHRTRPVDRQPLLNSSAVEVCVCVCVCLSLEVHTVSVCVCTCACVSLKTSEDVFQESRAQGHGCAAAPCVRAP